jgi:F420-0:gamma-glutamyl ligase-like protein
MKTTTIIIGALIALIVGGATGYAFGRAGINDDTQTKKLQDSVVMMKEQSANIRKMGEMMKSAGVVMQELGMKYKDEEVIAKGKDLEVVGGKYIAEDTKATESSNSMKETME